MNNPDAGTSRIHLVPRVEDGWELRGSSDGPALQTHPTRDAALDSARFVLGASRGGEVYVHDEDGTVVQVLMVQARPRAVKRPWWYIQPRPIAVILGVAVIALGVWGFSTIQQPTLFLTVVQIAVIIVGSAHLIAVALSWNWRRNRIG